VALLNNRRYTRVSFVLAQPTLLAYRLGRSRELSGGLALDRHREFFGEGRETWLEAARTIAGGIIPTVLLWGVGGYGVIWTVFRPALSSLPTVLFHVVDVVLSILFFMCLTIQAAPFLAWLLFPRSAPRKKMQPRDALLLNGLAFALAVPLGLITALLNPR
jgi:hypothetical protein